MGTWGVVFDPLGSDFSIAVAVVGAWSVLLAIWGPSRWRVAAATVLGLATLALPVLLWMQPPVWRKTLLFLLLPVASGIALLYGGLHWRRPSVRARAILVLAVLNGASSMTLHPWTDYYHWLWASTPALLLAAFGASELHRVLAGRPFPLRACVVVAQCALLAVWAVPEIHALRGGQARRLRDTVSGDVPVERRSVPELQQVIDFVNRHVPEDGYVLELPGSLYCFLTGRRQAANLDYFYVLDDEIWDEEGEIEAIRRRDPTYALVRSDFIGWQRAFPKLARFVDAHFELDWSLGRVEIFKKRTAPPSRFGAAPDGPQARSPR
jgi:hypothetical protein